jgi:hypothetical protein
MSKLSKQLHLYSVILCSYIKFSEIVDQGKAWWLDGVMHASWPARIHVSDLASTVLDARFS